MLHTHWHLCTPAEKKGTHLRPEWTEALEVSVEACQETLSSSRTVAVYEFVTPCLQKSINCGTIVHYIS